MGAENISRRMREMRGFQVNSRLDKRGEPLARRFGAVWSQEEAAPEPDNTRTTSEELRRAATRS
jgi:hypothetical protein